MVVNGGILTIGAADSSISAGASIPVYGGKVVLAEKAKFASALKVEGGAVELRDGSTAQRKISVGKNGETPLGGSLSVTGTVSVALGVELAGTASGTFAAGSVVNGGAITLNGGSIIWSGLLTVNKGVSVVTGTLGSLEGTEASFAGTMTNDGVLKISENAKIVFSEEAVFTTGLGKEINLAEGASLRLESGIADGNVLAGTLAGSGKLTLTQDTSFAANLDEFAGTLEIENGILSVGEAHALNIAKGGVLEIGVSDTTDWLSVKIADRGSLSFAEGASLVVDFSGILGDTSSFTVMSWEETSTVSGLLDLERGSGISLYVGGVAYENDNWYFEVADNALNVNLDVVVIDVTGKEQEASLRNEDYVANFSPKLESFEGKISGSGDVNSSGTLTFTGDFSEFEGTVYVTGGDFKLASEARLGNEDYVVAESGTLRVKGTREFDKQVSGAGTLATSGTITLSGDASAHTGTTKVEAGSLTIAQGAKLGTGAFDVAGTLAFIGDRTFENATLGAGMLDVVSGNLTFTKSVGTAILDISESASATFTGASTGFAGTLTGAGSLATTQDFALSGDASGFSGKTSVTAGTFTVAETAKLGEGDFEVAGTLALNGDRMFKNTTSGDGKLEVASGTTAFATDIGMKMLSVAQGASATLNDGVDLTHAGAEAQVTGTLTLNGERDFSAMLSGTGKLATNGNVNFSSDASAFSGATNVSAGTLTVAENAKLGEGSFEVAGMLALNGDRTFKNMASGSGTLRIVSGATTFTNGVGTTTLDISESASATFTEASTGFAGRLTGAGSLTTAQDFALSGDASGFSGKTSVTAGTLTVAETAKLGEGDFEVAGTLALNGDRTLKNATSGDGKLEIVSGATTFTNDVGVRMVAVEQDASATLNDGVDLTHENVNTRISGTLVLSGKRDAISVPLSGSGKVVLASGSDASFDRAVGVKTLSVEDGATLRGNVVMSYEIGARLLLSGKLELNAGKDEEVLLDGGRVVLGKTASLNLQFSDDENKRSRSNALGGDGVDFDEVVTIFEDGIVEGDVKKFLESDATLSKLAVDSLVIYDLSSGLNVRVSPGVDESVNIGAQGFSASYLEWAMKDIFGTFDLLQSGFWKADDPIFSGGNDPLLNAVIADNAEAARAILDRLSPKSYAAMFAMSAESFHADTRGIAARLEQRRYDGFSENARWEFFAQAQGSSVENDTAPDSATFDFDTTGVLAGADYKAGADTIVGFAFGADKGEADIHNGGGKIESSDFRLTGYVGEAFVGHFYVNAGAQLGCASYEVKRRTDYGKASGETDGLSIGLFAETGALLPISSANNLYATPYVGLAYMHTQIEAFEERGGDSAFDAAEIKGDSLRARVGCGLSWGFDLAGTVWRLGLDVAYSHDFIGDEIDIDVVSRDGYAISETARALPESMLSVGPTLNINLSPVISLYGGYTFNSGTDSYVNHSANLGFRMRF